jgi:hydroxypyruvate isomerase
MDSVSKTLSRREALELMAGSALVLSAPLTGSDAEENDLPRMNHSLFRHSVCRWCFSGIPLEKFALDVKPLGIRSIELLEPIEWPVVQRAGLTCALANGTTRIDEGFNRRENHARFVPSMKERIAQCSDAGLPNVICFSGNRNRLSDEEGLENCAQGLKQIILTAEQKRVTVVMELLNSKVDHKDYQCDHTAWGVELVKRVGSERFKLLYDIYHMQIMEGDIIATIRDYHSYIGHYHTGGCPGRHEIDDSQELNYAAIMREIAVTGFSGFVAQEFLPTRDPLRSLADAIRICSV